MASRPATNESRAPLSTYLKKRDFAATTEPRGGARRGPKSSPNPLRTFVVHKHAASHLHYDFRLELDGVLLSWAIPKEPTLDPTVKRLAIETEPHPLEYAGFEGTIPEGQYGGGTVMVWDRGSWLPEGDPRADLLKGRLSFTLQGQRLHGKWHLVRTKSNGKPAWLLFKAKDEFARSPSDAGEGEATTKPGARKPSLANIPGAIPGPLARSLEPQLATLVDRPPAGDGYIHELKFDGYRVVARLEGEEVQLFSRSGLDWTERVPELEAAVAALPATAALLDGELVALDGRGVSDFQTLQNSLHQTQRPALIYYVFDLLHLDGVDLRECTLLERKAVLKKLLAQAPTRSTHHIRLSEHVFGGGAKFFAEAGKQELEGIISKRADSPYRSGRTQDWLKVKCFKRQEFVIVGYTQPKGARSFLGALLLGLWQGSELVYAGRVGTGFTETSLRELNRKLISISVAESPAKHSLPRASMRAVTWVEPKLVVEIAFTGFTKDGLLRHPSFLGLRDDKDARSIELETVLDVAEKPSAPPDAKKVASSFPITHPTKILYPKLGITKRELLDYYALVAERMLPHIANRPLTLVRCPNGQGRPCFFQKHLGGGAPAGVREVVDTEGGEPYAALDSIEGLLGLVQLGALEIHTWGSRAEDLERPDILVFDLDPDPEVEFSVVVDAAKELRDIFAAASLQSFVKTTGGKGLHVCIPIEPDLNWDEAKAFCREVATALVAQSPSRYVATASKAKRKGRIFIDYLRNARGATFVAPYSSRAHENATVATPLHWDELTSKLKPQEFDVRNLKQRLSQRTQDPFLAFATLKQKLPKVRSS